MSFELHIFRGNPGHQYWEQYALNYSYGYNIITALMEIQQNPVTLQGNKVEPVVWEMGCLEEVCGSCSMLINGRPRQACTALIEQLIEETGSSVITIAPFTKYPLVRDLIVDRSAMFDSLKKARAWLSVEGSKPSEEYVKMSPDKQDVLYTLSTCMTCGCCTEACPQVNEKSAFMGPAVVSQVRLFNAHPVGKYEQSKRLQVMMEEGGVNGCGNAQNCVRVCPKKIPLTESIAAIFRDTGEEALRRLFSQPDRE